jgi:hypothetical protein
MKYLTLIKILETLCHEAPASYKRYKPAKNEPEKLVRARSLAFIHLYLKVKFGLVEFATREGFITDDPNDGGVDAFFLDEETKVVYMIQSKFRMTESNFEEKEIAPDELLSMEVARITKGQVADSKGNNFNDKIRAFQKRLQETRDIARYDFKVIILANLKKFSDEQVRRLIDNCNYEVFDFERTYRELVFPVCTGTYYDPNQIEIRLDLLRKHSPQLYQEVETLFGISELRIIYVPLIEIARVVLRYKNALLRFNPRNFLSLSNNQVNKCIRDTAVNDTKNVFALLNNGITILCSYASMTDRTGATGVGQLVIRNPQIINGGQTACSLAEAFCKDTANEAKMRDKEVLLKVVSEPKGLPADRLSEFIELISDATNQQTRVVEADRRANDLKMRQIQDYFYNSHGLFLEKKKGEFLYGLQDHYLNKNQIVNRVDLIRNYLAFSGGVAKARTSQTVIFEESAFETMLATFDQRKIFLSYSVAQDLEALVRPFAKMPKKPNYASGYAKYAILAACGFVADRPSSGSGSLKQEGGLILKLVTDNWSDFEKRIRLLPHNSKYVGTTGFSYDNYYKGDTVDGDVKEFFNPEAILKAEQPRFQFASANSDANISGV